MQDEKHWLKQTIFLFFSFFFPFIFISWRLITLQYCSGFCHTLTWISHGFTCVPRPNPPSHLPLHPIPLGLPSAPAPEHLSHASNLGLWSVSPLIVYLSMLFSQNIPPSPSPTEKTDYFSTYSKKSPDCCCIPYSFKLPKGKLYAYFIIGSLVPCLVTSPINIR